jgi:hypothetical protein
MPGSDLVEASFFPVAALKDVDSLGELLGGPRATDKPAGLVGS